MLQESKEVRRGATGEQSSVSAGLDGGHVTGQDARGLVADPENPAMKRNQIPARNPRLDLGGAESRRAQFLTSHNTVRARRNCGDLFLDCPALWS
jgi:hypothetical protein